MGKFKKVASRWFTTDGRSGRQEFILISILTAALMAIVRYCDEHSLSSLYFLTLLLAFVSFGLSLFANVRRWHDLGRSGWWILIGLAPVLNIFVIIYLCVKAGTQGPNQYGQQASSPLTHSS
ncbi:MAG: DUF805 domain-containing protein [Bdellovibrionia bacterium]